MYFKCKSSVFHKRQTLPLIKWQTHTVSLQWQRVSVCLDQGFLVIPDFLTINCNFSPRLSPLCSNFDSSLSSSLWICPLFFSSLQPPGTPCVLPASFYLSLSICVAVKYPSIREKKHCWSPVPPIQSPWSRSVFAYKHISAYLHVRGTGKNAVYSRILYYIRI